MGFTEPDPREDLSGQDVARKLLILARQIGLKMDLDEVEVDSLVPAALARGAYSSRFLTAFQRYDEALCADAACRPGSRRRRRCHGDGGVLGHPQAAALPPALRLPPLMNPAL